MELKDDFKKMDIETYFNIMGTKDGYFDFINSFDKLEKSDINENDNQKKTEEKVVLNEIKKIDEMDLYILKLQLRLGYLFTSEEELLSNEEKIKILKTKLQEYINYYKSYGKDIGFISSSLRSVIGKINK